MLTYSIQIFVCVIKLPWKEIADQQWWHCKIKEEKDYQKSPFQPLITATSIVEGKVSEQIIN